VEDMLQMNNYLVEDMLEEDNYLVVDKQKVGNFLVEDKVHLAEMDNYLKYNFFVMDNLKVDILGYTFLLIIIKK
jgi:hypothetical protein